MPSLTPLHETYCKWDRTPPSQADVLEGLAQLFSTSLNGVHELIQVINIEVLKNAFGISAQNAKNFQKRPSVQKAYQFSYGAFSVHDKFHRTLILSGFCLLKIAKISL
ncbi:hypothetical protein L1W78_09390, partial [Acinetobacter baumannii]|nr:hypothetical protein [Acinetobacter baumannii]MCF4248804.1 hypothetical protein [Acinetobacter baumannii]